jgi:tellurite methyltransferase
VVRGPWPVVREESPRTTDHFIDMNERIAKWNERYAAGEGLHEMRPSSPLEAAVEGVEPGLALDVACGAGRHALFLAERGWRVVAVDGSARGVERMMDEAARRGVAARIDARVADLESRPRGFSVEPGAYDLVCDFYFLDRSLFDELREGVRPGGLFVAAIHMADPETGAGHGYLLEPGELEATVRGWDWEVLHAAEGASKEGGHHHATAEIVARRPATQSRAR